MKTFISERELEKLSNATGKTEEELKATLGLLIYGNAWDNTNQEIIDRVNKRLRGVYVAPAWIEGLRRH